MLGIILVILELVLLLGKELMIRKLVKLKNFNMKFLVKQRIYYFINKYEKKFFYYNLYKNF